MGYPGRTSEVAMLVSHAAGDRIASVEPVADAESIAAAIEAIRAVYVAPVINNYIVSIVEATRSHPDLRLGASPRASLHLMRASRVEAALAGRDYVIPEDVKAVGRAVLGHRITIKPELWMTESSGLSVVGDVLGRVATPTALEGR